MTLIEIVGSDTRMDSWEWTDPINKLPAKCAQCGFPDLDHVPQPYYLIPSRTHIVRQVALAHAGNFLVQSRARQVLEIVAPYQCRFYPTEYLQLEGAATPWMLAVPERTVVTGELDPCVPRCEACGEPAYAHPDKHYQRAYAGSPWRRKDPRDGDVFKSLNWSSHAVHWNRWIVRELIFSVRFYHLLTRIGIDGLHEAAPTLTAPTDADLEWIENQIELLDGSGVPACAAPAYANKQ